MTGTERLRTLAGAWEEWGLGGTLAEMADEIDRELRDERNRWEGDLYEAQVAWNRVTGVCLEMERHCLYNEDTVVRDAARWARELRHAMKSDASDECDAQNPSCMCTAEKADVTPGAAKVTRDPAEDVSVSAYDLLPADDRDAIAWVREHGGLDSVKKLLDWVVGHCHTKPEIDTWQRIEEDAGCTATKYNERRGTIFTTKQQVARDLVRRCRALAERERGE